LMYDVFWYWLLMYGGWTMYGDNEHCMVDELTDVYMMPFATCFWCMVDELCMMDNGCIYV
jgi:hypothetical protein